MRVRAPGLRRGKRGLLPWLAGVLCVLLGLAILILASVLTRGVSYGAGIQPASNIPANGYGVNVELDKIVRLQDLQRSVDLIHGAGFGFVRQVFSWDQIEISAKGDFYDHKNGKSAWDKYDRLVDTADAAGLQVIARLERPPAWARQPGTAETAPPANYADYGDYVFAFVQHFKGRIHYIQIWNEPNRFEDWGNQPVDPVAYTRLLKIAYQRAKQADPSIQVLSAALTPTTDCCQKNRPDPVYLQEMYDAGARGSFDILGAQAYGLRTGPEDPWQDLPLHPNSARKAIVDSHNTNFGRVVLDRQVMVRNGDAAKPVWVCEFGWNALPAGWTGDASPWGSVSLQQQATYTVQALQRAQREWPWLGVMNLWLFQDPSPAPRDPTQFFGLVGSNFQPRPVYDAVKSLIHAPPVAHTGSTPPTLIGAWQGATSPISGATASLRFEGNAVSLKTRRGPGMGIAYVTIDGSATYATDVPKDSSGRAAIDLYAPSQTATVVSLASGLPYGAHDLAVTVSGLKDARSSGPAVEIDSFDVGLTRDQRPLYAGGALVGLGLLILLWNAAATLAASGKLPSIHGMASAQGLSPGEGERRGTANLGLAGGREFGMLPGALTVLEREVVAGGALAAALAVSYFGRPLPVALAGAAVFFTLALVRLDLALVFVPLVAPFYLQPVHLRGSELPLTEVLIGLCLAAYLVRTAWHGEWRWPKSAFTWPALLFFAAASVSVLAAQYPKFALREWRTDILEPLILFGLIVLVRPKVRQMLHALLAGGTIVALTGIVLYAGRHGVQAGGVLRMVGVYRSPDNFALYLGRLAPIAAALMLLAPVRLSWRAAYAAVTALTLVGVVLSFTRGAWLGDAVALLVVAAFAGRNWLAAVVAGGAVAGIALASLQAKRVQSIFQLTPGSTSFSRIELWRATVHMIRDHPLFGVGLDNFLYQYPHYILAQARNEPDLSHPHDIVLDFWSRIGIFGLAALIWLEVVFFRLTARIVKTSTGFERAAAIGLMASMIDCLVHGLVDNSYFLIDLSLVFWFTLGLVQLLAETDR